MKNSVLIISNSAEFKVKFKSAVKGLCSSSKIQVHRYHNMVLFAFLHAGQKMGCIKRKLEKVSEVRSPAKLLPVEKCAPETSGYKVQDVITHPPGLRCRALTSAFILLVRENSI